MDTSMEIEELLKGLFAAGDAQEEKKEPTSPLDAIDPEMLFRLMDIWGELGTEDDAERLLYALKPFISPTRAARVEEAVRMMKLYKAAEAAMKIMGNRRNEQ